MQLNATCGEPATPAPDQIGELEPLQELVLTAFLAGKPYRERIRVNSDFLWGRNMS
jgi:hypothetical protein